MIAVGQEEGINYASTCSVGDHGEPWLSLGPVRMCPGCGGIRPKDWRGVQGVELCVVVVRAMDPQWSKPFPLGWVCMATRARPASKK